MAPKRKATNASQQACAGSSEGGGAEVTNQGENPRSLRRRQAPGRSAVPDDSNSQEATGQDFDNDEQDFANVTSAAPAAAGAQSRAATPEEEQEALTGQAAANVSTRLHTRQPPAHHNAGPSGLFGPSRTGARSTHGIDGSLVQMLMSGMTKMLDELQGQTVLQMETRDILQELLTLHKEKPQGYTAGPEEPTTLTPDEVSQCTEIAQKVFREDPYAENRTVMEHIKEFFGATSQYDLEKVKGTKTFTLIKSKVNGALKNVRFSTAAATRDAMSKKHKEELGEKATVTDREKANALFDKYQLIDGDLLPLVAVELAKTVYKDVVVVAENTGTISNLTKAQMAFMWSVALWTLHPEGSAKLPMGQNNTYERIKRRIGAALDPLGDNRQFSWAQR